jgi:hypothetical protein
MSRSRSLALSAALLAAACARTVQESPAPASPTASPAGEAPAEMPLAYPARPTVAAITAADLMSRLYAFADDSMQGRMAGQPANDRGTDFIAAYARALGLQPAGENGTYFQQVMARRTIVAATPLSVDGRTFALWTDVLVRSQSDQDARERAFDGATAVYGGVYGDPARMLAPDRAAGKVVVITVPPLANGAPGWQTDRAALSSRYAGAAAIVIASLDAMPAPVREQFSSGGVGVRSSATPTRELPTFMYVNAAAARAILGGEPAAMRLGAAGRVVHGAFTSAESPAPGRNVVAVLPGSDPALRGQYVAIGAHNDHVGTSSRALDHDSLRAFNTVVRPLGADSPNRRASAAEQTRIRAVLDSLRARRPARRDSIYNGADDDGSGSMAVLEIAEALASSPTKPRRSILFVWHTAEELGLFGSAYFTEHPTVPRDSIVAQVNIDMIGRGTARDLEGGSPGYLQLIGSRRLSTELGDLVEAVNKSQSQPLAFDYQYDATGHPEQFYCRSDHYNYARWGIPVVFFSTGSHQDYHQLTDEPQYIAYEKYARVTQFIHDVALRVANLDHRPVVDKPKPDPHGECRQ